MRSLCPTDRSILVTGGAGFIGSHLADALVADNDVTVLDDLSTGDPENVPESAALIEADICDPEVLRKATADVDLVFHEAALVSVNRSVEEPRRSHGINVDATIELLELARERDFRVVLASSCAIYGQPETVPIPETEPPEPTSPYGLDKLALDHYARLYHDLYGVETVPLRYFNVYGPRQAAGDYSGVISIFLRQALAGEPITVHGDGGQTRDFVHVSDVVRANLLAATTDHVGRAFNVGTGSRTTIRELAETIRDATGSDAEIVHTDPRAGDIDHSCADLEKTRKLLGYDPEISLLDGLENLVEQRRTG